MSDVPNQSPTPEPTPTPPPEPTPEPTPEPKEEKPALINQPAVETFAPEKLTLPEGFEKNEHFDKFTELMKEMSHATAQNLVNLYSEAAKQIVQSNADAWNATNDKWQEEIKADKELGGVNLPKVLQTVSKVLDNPEFADPGIREALELTGAGNNPAIVRTLYRMAAKLSEGSSVAGDAPGRNANGQLAQQPQTLAEAIYGPTGPHTGGPKLS